VNHEDGPAFPCTVKKSRMSSFDLPIRILRGLLRGIEWAAQIGSRPHHPRCVEGAAIMDCQKRYPAIRRIRMATMAAISIVFVHCRCSHVVVPAQSTTVCSLV